MFPKLKLAISFKPSFAEDFSVVVLALGLRCSLINVTLASMSRKIAVPLKGSLILAFSGVDSGISIVKLNWTLRPVNCHSVDLCIPNLNSEAWE